VPQAAAQLTVSRSDIRYVPATSPDIVAAWQQEIGYFRSIGVFKDDFQIRDDIAADFDSVITSENASVAGGG